MNKRRRNKRRKKRFWIQLEKRFDEIYLAMDEHSEYFRRLHIISTLMAEKSIQVEGE